MRALIVCLILAALLPTPAVAHHRSGHGKRQTVEEAKRPAPSANGALQVVDTSDTVVGHLTFNGCFVRHVDEYWVDLCGVQTDGTVVNEALPTRYFVEPGCHGTAFVESFSGALLSRFAYTAHGRFEFVGDPIAVITVASWQYQSSSVEDTWTCIDNEQDVGDGVSFPSFELLAGPLHSLPLSTLGTPPFRIR